ncbi:N-acetyltransferase [Tessaracoccus sp. OH4464_COT-324]|uniref:GNAT family N-acetyltransferase n=1 Tax=Tessaracoccus sp. OH4464_COT-324 TaxID=2491059 RepID=UPI001319FCAC|nr:GNAT family N-acetyltransferase [Tessaracoccus sp. OH4464_COT-324]
MPTRLAGRYASSVLEYTIEDLNPDEVHDVVFAHAAMQVTTYATLADAGFAAKVSEGLASRVESLLAAPVCKVAKSARGNVLGLGMVVDGPEWWEMPEADDFVWPAVTRYLSTLFTMPGTHGSGLGKALLDAVLPGREAAYLWTEVGNERARRFYEREGFAADGYTKRTTGWGDMLMMRMVRTQPA